MYESTIQDISVVVPMKCLAELLEVGELFAFLGSDEASTLLESMSMGTRKNLNLKNLRSQSLSL